MTDTLEETETGRIITPDEKGKFNKGRRRFLANTGMYGAGLFGSALLGACSDNDVFAQDEEDDAPEGPSDAAVLQFALNLEYLEAEFYLLGTTGMGLPADLIGDNPGAVSTTGTGPVSFTDNVTRNYAFEIAADERDHVRFLRAALGQAGVPVPDRPALDLNQAFKTAAAAAGLPNAENFDPFANQTNFLLAAYIFEDVGVTAYKGGAPFITNPTFLSAAAGILAAEAYHAGLVRTVLYSLGMEVRGITDAISGARDSLDGPSNIDQGTSNRMVTLNGQTYTASNIVPLDENGIAFSRTPGQVHNIAYLNSASVDSGGFFPNGTSIPANPALQVSADSTASGGGSTNG